MQYRQGSFGRVFLLKFEDHDDLLAEIKKLARTEKVNVGTVMLLGGMRTAGVVAGPREAVIPPEPLWKEFSDAREVLGFGTFFYKGEGDEPVLHLHGAIGRGGETITGCIRRDGTVFLVIEAVITEILGTDAYKAHDDATGVAMLKFRS
ncbi:MAG: DNA-binding protein [Deltaproteobacteria bacterium]|nr:DNA-binding protein [Deltaproteobacteria bacterium]